jgi:hypothetical protein
VRFFLIVFDRAHGRIVQDVREFPEDRRDEALAARFREEDNHRNDSDIEVVVLGAADREALENTHSRYFGTIRELSG